LAAGFVNYNVLFGQWTAQNQLYWGTSTIRANVYHPFSVSPEDSGANFEYYRFQGDDYQFEYPSVNFKLAEEDRFRFEYSSPHRQGWDQTSYTEFVDLSFSLTGVENWSLSVSNRGGQLTIIKCHYVYGPNYSPGCQQWTPANGWHEYIRYG